jgi:hypothetical protein
MFRTRHKVHIRAIQYNRDNSKFSCHILNTAHSYWPIEEIK